MKYPCTMTVLKNALGATGLTGILFWTIVATSENGTYELAWHVAGITATICFAFMLLVVTPIMFVAESLVHWLQK